MFSTVTSSYSSGQASSDEDDDEDECDSEEEDSEDISARARRNCCAIIREEEDCENCCDFSNCFSCCRLPLCCRSADPGTVVAKLPRDDVIGDTAGQPVSCCERLCAFCHSTAQKIRRFRACVCDLVEFRENGKYQTKQ